jgi:hypothetical protein
MWEGKEEQEKEEEDKEEVEGTEKGESSSRSWNLAKYS